MIWQFRHLWVQPSFVTAVEEKTDGDAKVEKVSRELWKRIWSKDQDITQPASLTEVPYWSTPNPYLSVLVSVHPKGRFILRRFQKNAQIHKLFHPLQAPCKLFHTLRASTPFSIHASKIYTSLHKPTQACKAVIGLLVWWLHPFWSLTFPVFIA